VSLSASCAAAARHALVLDDLAIKVVLGLDNAAKEHPAVHAGAQTLQAGVVRLYRVVIVVVGVYPRCVHKSSLWAGSRGAATPAGPFRYLTASILLYSSTFVYEYAIMFS
jgi:hypothetical protein